VNKLSEAEIREIFAEAVAIEKEFIIEALPCNLLGMNSSLMSTYIEYVANRTIKQLGHKPIFPEKPNPFPWMDTISLAREVRFFEARSAEYRTGFSVDTKQEEFDFDADV
jgi:ribonucleoside-diphosphate reductase subunit M2